MNIFETAARNKFRFESVRGLLTTEQLFDLPLTSRTGFDLDNVARTVNTALKAVTEESFVETRSNTGRRELETKLDIVKFVIADRQAQNEAARTRAEKLAKRQKILDAIDQAETRELTSKGVADLRAELEALDV